MLQVVVTARFVVALVAHIGGVAQDSADFGHAPAHITVAVLSPTNAEFIADFLFTVAVQIQIKNHADGFGLVFVDNVGVSHTVVADDIAVAVEDAVVPADFLTCTDALGNFAAFFLGQGRHDGKAEFAVAVHRPDVILDEIDLHAVVFQFAGHYQRVHGVAGKAADLAGDDQSPPSWRPLSSA